MERLSTQGERQGRSVEKKADGGKVERVAGIYCEGEFFFECQYFCYNLFREINILKQEIVVISCVLVVARVT